MCFHILRGWIYKNPFLIRFILYINNTPTKFNICLCFCSSQLLCFADDVKIFTRITCISDTQKIQADLGRLKRYGFGNELDLNASKCCVVSFSRKHNTITFDYVLKVEKVQRVSKVSDLGACMIPNCSLILISMPLSLKPLGHWDLRCVAQLTFKMPKRLKSYTVPLCVVIWNRFLRSSRQDTTRIYRALRE